MPVPDMDLLNRRIAEAGADWVASETPYSALYGVTQGADALGLALRPEDVYPSMLTARLNEAVNFSAAPPPPASPSPRSRPSNRGF
jgi:hypothetical protein